MPHFYSIAAKLQTNYKSIFNKYVTSVIICQLLSQNHPFVKFVTVIQNKARRDRASTERAPGREFAAAESDEAPALNSIERSTWGLASCAARPAQACLSPCAPMSTERAPGREFAAAKPAQMPGNRDAQSGRSSRSESTERSTCLAPVLVSASRDITTHMGTGTLVSALRHKMPDPKCSGNSNLCANEHRTSTGPGICCGEARTNARQPRCAAREKLLLRINRAKHVPRSGACIGFARYSDAHGDRHACVGIATQDARPQVLREWHLVRQ